MTSAAALRVSMQWSRDKRSRGAGLPAAKESLEHFRIFCSPLNTPNPVAENITCALQGAPAAGSI